MMNTNTLGWLFGHLLIFAVTMFCGYAAAAFVTSQMNPTDWSPAARLVFLGTNFIIYPRLLAREE